jgi:polar amino acid transport system substrate-binding protein
VVHLTSLEWPPYAGENLPQQGSSIAAARAAFAAVGYELKVTFFPWSRAVALVKSSDSKFMGYFPEYYSKSTADNFFYSDEIGSGPLGFAERKSKSIPWVDLTDLSPYRIGIVQDYINTEAFDLMVEEKTLTTSSTISDINNLKKLMSGRLDLAVIDKNVMDYLFATDPSLIEKSHLAQFNNTLLEEKELYICFKKSPQGEKIKNLLNKGLKELK